MAVFDFNDYFCYDESSKSHIRWKVSVTTGDHYQVTLVDSGDEAGWLDNNGYYMVQLNGTTYPVHRVIWEMLVGPIPEGHFIDHKDGVRSHNIVSNLRPIHRDYNNRNTKMYGNNSSGVTGVQFITHRSCSYWAAAWRKDNKRRNKWFSCRKLGNDEAFRLACEYREKMIAELNEQGAGYTHDHGKR